MMYGFVYFNNYFIICILVMIKKSTEKEKKIRLKWIKTQSKNNYYFLFSLIALTVNDQCIVKSNQLL